MNKIKELRLAAGMKQSDLAARLNVSANAVSNYEVGIREIDSATICKLCDVFGCTADYLLGRAAVPSPELTPDEEALLLSWRAAPPEIRAIVDVALSPYKKDAISSETA